MRLLLPVPRGLLQPAPLPVLLGRRLRGNAVGRERVPGACSPGWPDVLGRSGGGCDARVHLVAHSGGLPRRCSCRSDRLGCCVRWAVGRRQFLPQHRSVAGIRRESSFRSIGVSRIRIDSGFSVAEIFPIASVLPIALIASTLRAADLAPFADLDVELIHNFYPQEWTGLALSSVAASVSVARQFGWRVGAYIAGDPVRQGPLGEGLPTVEEHRNMPRLFQALSLVDAGADDVYVGDPALTYNAWSRLGSFVRDDLVVLDGTAAPGVHPAVIEALTIPDRNRPDAAEAMIRLEHSRERFARLPLPKVGGQPRPAGSVTVQLASAGRHCGEVVIILRDLPADDRVALLGMVDVSLPSVGARSLTTRFR
ncbi:MupG family TIM beta-alpha barrel fold protein [Curtobacterium flaccumfaciens pv. flaccumfaciens]|nr:MupG family TIM beta-alpha barrel fold protein [Curtobacterium flaccumfaciens pv. flaccumfaciens]MCX2784717.1 MupG family TIM beta-alpha barrel fold protein [Curtobacterium flaccumfaciens pv. flaccumfaciens]